MQDRQTLDYYRRSAASYTASGANGQSRQLPAFLDRLPPGAYILELGCGGGHDALAMIGAGFRITATDGTPEIAAKAEQLISQPVKVMAFHELDAVAQFDAIWAHCSLLHVPRQGLPDILARIWRALKPGGWHCATYKNGNGEDGRDRFGRYFNYLQPDLIAQLYQNSGDWDFIEMKQYHSKGHDEVVGPRTAITVRKVKDDGRRK